MKIKIEEDELYPYYRIKALNNWRKEIYELPAKVVNDYIEAEKQFDKTRDKLIKALDKAKVTSYSEPAIVNVSQQRRKHGVPS